MTRHAETALALAHEITMTGSDSYLSGILSAPKKTTEAQRVRMRFLAKTGDWQIEKQKGAQAYHTNLSIHEFESWLASVLGAAYTRASFTGNSRTLDILANRRGELTAIRNDLRQTSQQSPSPASHNRVKNYILPEGIPVPFLVDLGVMTQDGAVIKAKYDKFRQINRFLEFIADVADDLNASRGERELNIIDFGSGKSYLTFAVYYYLNEIRGIPARITGLDLKADVISHCASLAKKYNYDRLSFAVGDIAGWKGETNADMVITLHACDTATDAALAQAVRWGAKVILSVPCCQHELNTQLQDGKPAPGRDIFASAFSHGIIRERMAALLTDSLRAGILEEAGYRVQILEFIDMSHTPKNLLIRAIRRTEGADLPAKDAAHPAGTTLPAKDIAGTWRALRDFIGATPALEADLGSAPSGEQKEKN